VYRTVEEAAAYCRVSVKTIYNHTSLGNIKSMPGTGKSLYREESLDEWLSTPPYRRKTQARK
jgi:excisionase family DNA binding protein